MPPSVARAFALALAPLAASAWAEARPRVVAPEPLVEVGAVAPGVRIALRYRAADNFTGQAVYPEEARCLLRRSVAERLAKAQRALAARALGLKVWDCYRPRAVQARLWALVPDPRYVADPSQGSRHNRGAAIDLTLVDAEGRELDLGTRFDDFSPRAHRDATGLPEGVRARRRLLEEAMAEAGFVPLPTEWWHFDAADWKRHPLADEPL